MTAGHSPSLFHMVRSRGEAGVPTGELSPKEISEKTRTILFQYAWLANASLHPMVEQEEGRSSIGSVPGRPADEQLIIDSVGENILANAIRDEKKETPYQAFVLGEHNIYNFSEGKPKVIYTIDAFDNSGEFKRGLDTPVYSVVGAYNSDGSPIGSVVVDLRGQKAFITMGDEVHVVDLSTPDMNFKELEIVRSARTTIKDPEGVVIASYVGERNYSRQYYNMFGAMEDNWSPKSRHYGNGGSFIYPYLAKGAIDAYVMFDEPHSEILPGLPLALARGCTAVSVDPVTGEQTEYKFDRSFVKNPENYTDGSVPLFIVSRTPELRDEIVEYYKNSRRLRKPKRT